MNKTENQSIATRYAKSLIGLNEENKLDNGMIYQNLENIKVILNSSNELYEALVNPIISATDKEAVIDAVFTNDTDELIRNFLKLLIRKNRFNLILEIIKIYNNLLDKINNVSKIEIISAIELDEEYKKQIKTKLSQILKKEIIVNYDVKDEIIAGLIYKMGDDVFDTSLNGKINKFKNAIIK